MDLTSKKNIKNLLKKHCAQPSKRLGQNFLSDRRALGRLILAAGLGSQDLVLEIGPGIGVLTQELAKRAKKVIAVEKDPKMLDVLEETLKNFKNIEVIREDILKFQVTKNYKVIGNLPFYLTAPVIRKFLESKYPPKEMLLIVQKEVGQRICSKPPRMNLLAVSVQIYGIPKIISYISKKSFWPQPKVDGAVIKIIPKAPLLGDRDLFFKIVKAGFSQPRKQLINNLSKGLKINKKMVEAWLLKNKIQPTQRAETLRIEDWLKLTKTIILTN